MCMTLREVFKGYFWLVLNYICVKWSEVSYTGVVIRNSYGGAQPTDAAGTNHQDYLNISLQTLNPVTQSRRTNRIIIDVSGDVLYIDVIGLMVKYIYKHLCCFALRLQFSRRLNNDNTSASLRQSSMCIHAPGIYDKHCFYKFYGTLRSLLLWLISVSRSNL